MAAEDDVRQASDRFCAALNRMLNGDTGPLSEVWSHESDVTTMHPLGGRQVGWEQQVRPAWEQVAQIASQGQVRLLDLLQQLGVMPHLELHKAVAQVLRAGKLMSRERSPPSSPAATCRARGPGHERTDD